MAVRIKDGDLIIECDTVDEALAYTGLIKTKRSLKSIQTSKRVSKGRRAVANGERPKITSAIATVLGNKSMASKEILDALTAKGWAPEASNPIGYISFLLSSNTDLFKRVSRGHYRVAKTPTTKSLLKNRERFPRNADLLQLLPERFRTKSLLKYGRDDLEHKINNLIVKNALTTEEVAAFQAALHSPTGSSESPLETRH